MGSKKGSVYKTTITVWIALVLIFLIYLLLSNRISADIITEPPRAGLPAIPNLNQWFSNWQNFGAKYYCDKERIEANGIIESGNGTYSAWYYDGMWGAYKLSDSVDGESEKAKWRLCATYFRKPYRDDYILANNGKITGWRIFPRGLYEDYLRTGDTKSKEALILMAKNAAYAYRNVASSSSVWHPSLSREVAYNIDAYLLAKKLAPTDKAFAQDDPYIDVAFTHIDKWTEWLANSPRTTKCDCGSAGLQPFMVALTIKSLFYVYEDIKNSTRPVDEQIKAKFREKIPRILDLLWEEAWGENHPEESGGRETFYYGSNTRDYANKEDLNLLIAPAYAVAWYLTGEERFQIRADKIFSAGVRKADLNYMGKIFSQNYFWSDKYVEIRKKGPGGDLKSGPTPSNPPAPAPPAPPPPATSPSPSSVPINKTPTISPSPKTTSPSPSLSSSPSPISGLLPIPKQIQESSEEVSSITGGSELQSKTQSLPSSTKTGLEGTKETKTLIEFNDSTESTISGEGGWQPLSPKGGMESYSPTEEKSGIELKKKIVVAGEEVEMQKGGKILVTLTNPNKTTFKGKIHLGIGILTEKGKIKIYWNKVKPQKVNLLGSETRIIEFELKSAERISSISVEVKLSLLKRILSWFGIKEKPLLLQKIEYQEE